MSYYQVILSLNNSEATSIQILIDATKHELVSKIVKPYKNGLNIFHNSTVIDCNEINKIIIICTVDKNEIEREKINSESLKKIKEINMQSDSLVFISPGSGYDPEDISEAGEDVTNKFIQGPPGYSKTGALQEFIYNPWIMTIFTGLILAALTYWLNWK